MKKLLIATMAAVSVGLYAKADTGISFDDANYEVDANLFNVSDQTGKYIVTSGWTTDATSDELFKIIEVDYPEEAVVRHADLSENEKALFIDTSVPLLRNAQEMSNDDYSYPAQDVSTPVFFDSVVQFTATDVKPIEDDKVGGNGTDKLMVWLYQSLEEEGSPAYIAITAGYKDSGTLKAKNYFTEVAIAPDSWHRLTIKSFKNAGGDLLFNVWVDGTKVVVGEGETAVSDFLSMFPDTANMDTYDKLQGVAFDGKGAVDDIVFTTTAPEFAREEEEVVEKFALNVAFADDIDDEVDATMIVLDVDGEYINPVDNKISSEINVRSENVCAWVTCSEDYVVSNNGASYDADGEYWIVPIDVSGATADGTLNVTITFEPADGGEGGGGDEPGTGDSDPETPTVGGTEIVVDATTGKITNITTADNGKAVVGELDTTKFAEYYTVSVTDGVLSIALNPAVATPEINETATDKDDAITVTDTAVALGVTNAKPGLWYGAQAYSDVACADDDKIGVVTGWVKATTTTVSVTAEKPEASAAFFKVVVDDQDHTTATPPAEQE